MSMLHVHREERRQAFWTIEGTAEDEALEVRVGSSGWVPLLWVEDETWSLWVQGPDTAIADTLTLSSGLSSVLIRRTSTGEIVMRDAGAFNVLTGCEWPVDWSACGVEPPEDPDLRERAEALAATTLTALTLGRVGGCPVTVRPCSRREWSGWWRSSLGGNNCSPFLPHINRLGEWVNACGCGISCHCGQAMSQVRLQMPVGRIDRVVVGGVALDPSAYRVRGHMLVRTDGDEWPACQDMTQPDDGPDAFAVTYLNAEPVDAIGAYAAGLLAVEYQQACTNGRCGLPSGVTQIARQGVTMEITRDMFAEGLTGIEAVDAYTARFNPNRLRVRPAVYSPDLR
jgi:hypothetical protein